MDDLISRQAAIDALGEKPLAWTEGEYELGLQNQWQSDVDALNDLPSAEPEPHWIPVTEQEPKESGKYLVTAIISFIPDHVDDPDTFEAVTTANYLADIRGSIKWWGNNVEKVLAWMPLPEPYKERMGE